MTQFKCPDLKGKRILVVEDDPISFELINHYLSESTAIVDHSPTAEVALNRMKKVSFDLVIMDIRLPGMDGHAATRKIRSI